MFNSTPPGTLFCHSSHVQETESAFKELNTIIPDNESSSVVKRELMDDIISEPVDRKHDTATVFGGNGSIASPTFNATRWTQIQSPSVLYSTKHGTRTTSQYEPMRHNSSPAGLLNDLVLDNGIHLVRDVGGSRAVTGKDMDPPRIALNKESTTSFSGMKRMRTNDQDDAVSISNNKFGFQNETTFSNPMHGLAHHLSLPKSTIQMTAMEKLMLLQHSIPVRIRAKRGHATHPRSIAERMRRMRISERIRRLQELFPNMDKTNIADMLEVAAEYIKELQKQVKVLNETQARCTCSSSV